MAEQMQPNDLQLSIGDTLLLQFAMDEHQRKHPTKVIGYLLGKSLVVTTPRIDGKVMLVREGQPLIIRMLSGNNVYAFNTQILTSSLKPYAHLHLTYPQDIEKIVVRKAMRVAADLDVTIDCINAEDPKLSQQAKGKVLDISTAGALLFAESGLGGNGDLLSLTMRVPLAGVQKFIKVPAVIRSVREQSAAADVLEGQPGGQPAGYLFGVEFQLLEEMDNILLHGFVYEQLQMQGAT